MSRRKTSGVQLFEARRRADLVIVSAMSVQKESVKGVITRCKAAGVRIVAGGPLFTTEYETFGDVDHLVLNEAEITLSRFVEDFQNGYAGHIPLISGQTYGRRPFRYGGLLM